MALISCYDHRLFDYINPGARLSPQVDFTFSVHLRLSSLVLVECSQLRELC